jgi:hypothetical protein
MPPAAALRVSKLGNVGNALAAMQRIGEVCERQATRVQSAFLALASVQLTQPEMHACSAATNG